eukprot:4951915-Karenia_brevis.AAC.1
MVMKIVVMMINITSAGAVDREFFGIGGPKMAQGGPGSPRPREPQGSPGRPKEGAGRPNYLSIKSGLPEFSGILRRIKRICRI